MKHWSAVGGALLLLLALVGGLWLTAPQPVTGQASVPCYREQGGAKWVGGSGCEWEMQSGATLDIQSGVTASISDLTVSDDLIVTDDATVGGDLVVSGTTTLVGAADVQGNLADSGGALTVADNALIDGQADVIQLTVQGHSTQTSNPNLLVVENSGGDDQFTVSATGDAMVADDLVVTDDASVGGDLTISGDMNLAAQTVISPTDGGVITPTGSYQRLSSAGTVTPTIATGAAAAGDVVVMVNTTATTINLADSGTAKLSAAAALGQYDTLTLLFDGTNWIELSRSDN
jgi:hypothetical protein